ncbi:MAG TPA: TauD/TfdA family dioxygenase [Burkholderiales bacterium]|nr:TauD/TfdA family dioxygenase [Burkholderiales bacterium]
MPIRTTPSGATLGATLEGLNLSRPSDAEVDAVVEALGRYGVVCFPRQDLTPRQLRDFSARLGELEVNVIGAHQEAGLPEVMTLSNVVENGKAVGLPDAGQGWHTDMSYSRTVAFANVLYALKVPQRDGRPLGATEFCDMCAAYDDLPAGIRRELEGKTALHDFAKFYDMMRLRPGSKRPPLTDAQRAAKPPVSHPMVITHPISKRRALYANPGYTIRVNELPEMEGDALLEYLFAHQTQDKYRYTFRWAPHDVLIWDNFRCIHQAIPDYGPAEHRLMKRCQVMASRFAPLPA